MGLELTPFQKNLKNYNLTGLLKVTRKLDRDITLLSQGRVHLGDNFEEMEVAFIFLCRVKVF